MNRPLDGIRVLDLGQIYQGPYCGLLLAYLGADVIKIEPPGGETIRDRSDDGETPEVQLLNAAKRGVTLNLKTTLGKQALRDLARESDVLIENFRVGTMDRLGVGYDTLSKINPRLVYAHGSGYGDTGPYTAYPAMDLTIQAMGGIMHTTGYPDQPPVKAGPAVADFLGGVHLVAGITSALYHRERTGEGQYVEVGMFDCVYPTLTSPLAAWVKASDVPPRTGNQHSGLAIAPYNVYPVEDGYVAVICITDGQWERFLRLAGRDDLIGDDRYATKVRRAERIKEVDRIVTDWLDGQTKADATDALLEHRIPAARVQTIDDIVTDPQLDHRGMLNYLENKGEGRPEIPVPGLPVSFPAADPYRVTPSPRVGEHTHEVLADIAGYTRDEIDALRDDDAI